MGRYFVEGASYTKADLVEARIEEELTGSDFKLVLETLCDLRAGSKRVFTQNGKDSYVFQYVGVIALDNYLYAILPKYYTDDDEGRALSDDACIRANVLPMIMDSIGKYNASDRAHETREQDKITLHGASERKVRQGRIELYRYILQDFAVNGLYDTTRRIREFNGEGEVEWNRTVNQIMPVITRRRPAYLDLITERRVHHTANIIARIQEAILVEISMTVKRLHLDEMLHLPTYERPVRTIDDLGGRDYVEHLLIRERGVQFETRKRMLLQALIDYLSVGEDSSISKVFADGTCSYDRVWEDICRTVFNDCNYEDKARPQWNFKIGSLWSGNSDEDPLSALEGDDDGIDETGAKAGSLIPDVISRIAGTNEWHIVDAKYYKPKWRKGKRRGEGKVSAVPGVGDVVKQYFYQMYLAYHEQNAEVKSNSFVMPAQISVNDLMRSDAPLLSRRGQVCLEYAETQPAPIGVFEMNPDKAMIMYLNNDKSQAQDLLEQMTNEQDKAHER